MIDEKAYTSIPLGKLCANASDTEEFARQLIETYEAAKRAALPIDRVERVAKALVAVDNGGYNRDCTKLAKVALAALADGAVDYLAVLEAAPGHWRGKVTESAINLPEGMTLRDYFAAHAPISLSDVAQFFGDTSLKQKSYTDAFAALAAMRDSYADAMMAERAEP